MPVRSPADMPRVDVRRAAPPDAPACPACGDPLFAWLGKDGEEPAVDRCETCRLTMSKGGRRPDRAGSVRALRERAASMGDTESLTIAVDDAGSMQAMVGAGQWSGLERREGHANLSRDAAERILRAEGLIVTRRRRLVRRGLAMMWQTLINLVTFERDFAPRALRGEIHPDSAASRARFAIDAAISVLIAVPVAALALMLELPAAALGNGGAVELSARREPSSPEL